MTKAPLLVTETVQQRLTLAGRFANSVGILSDEEVSHLLKNENHSEVPELVRIAANLGRDQRIALKESVKTDSPRITIPSELAEEWESFWKAEYGIKADLAELQIPRQPLGYKARLVVIHEKASQSPEMLYQSDAKAYGGKIWRFTEKDLDETAPLHKPLEKLLSGTFGFWAADEQEAPDGCVGNINLNTAAVDDIGWITESLPMRQVHGRKHWREHEIQPDQNVVTFCAGSRFAGGNVPGMNFDRDYGLVYVFAYGPQDAYDNVRFRRAVV